MKRIFYTLSILAVSTAFASCTPAKPDDPEPARPTDVESAPIEGGVEVRGEPFAGFPLDQARTVDFEVDASFREQLTEREMRDQALDWLLYTAVADAGLSTTEVNEALFDLAPVRHGYLSPVASFEYGVTRARFVGDGRVVALLPAVAGDERGDLLAHVADEQRKNLGAIPREIVPFEYVLDPGLGSATVTRRPPLPAAELFTDRYGYHEAGIASLEDLDRFLERIEDVTYVRREGDRLTLGGRELRSRRYGGLDVEDIAALWQSEAAISDPFPLGALGGVTESGFSLDPDFDPAGFVEGLPPLVERLNRLIEEGLIDAPPVDVEELMTALTLGLPGPALERLQELVDEGNEAALSWAKDLRGLGSYQAARYDGELQGTEVGMTLFYTDLLAKLWALDFLGNAPEERIQDFRPMTTVAVPAVFREEIMKHNQTRVWFGNTDSGFQPVGNGRELLFGRNATRVYAATTTDDARPGEEGEPSAASEAFIGWWASHFEEVARFEPQYERLNEIMKWSAILGFLNHHDTAHLLGFLEGVEVDHSNWFPTWASKRADLRFRAWKGIDFKERGFAGTKTEALELLESELFAPPGEVEKNTRLSGGVSLVGRSHFGTRRPVPASVKSLTRRSGRIYDDSAPGVFKTLDGRAYKLDQVRPGVARSVTTPRPQALHRNRFGEISRAPLEQWVTRTDEGLRFDARLDGDGFGSLPITTTVNGFRTGWRGRDVDQGFALARRLSKAEDLPRALAQDPHVAAYLKLPGRDFAVKLESADWHRLRIEDKPTVDLPSRWDGRVSDPTEGHHNLLFARTDYRILDQSIEPSGWISFAAAGPAGRRPLRLELIRGPPAGWRTVEFVDGDVRLAARTDPETGAVAIQWSDLPEAARRNLEVVGRRLTAAGGDGGAGPIRIDGGNGRGDFLQAARPYAEQPEGSQQALRYWLLQEIESSRRLAAERELGSALQVLDTAIERYGAVPELNLEKAFLLIDRGKVDEAVQVLEKGPGTLALDSYKELPQWLRRSGPTNLGNARKALEFVSAHDSIARLTPSPGRMVPFADGGKLDYSFLWAHTPDGRVVSDGGLGAVVQAGRKLYVQDSLLRDKPGLQLDSPAAIQRSLEELVSSQDVVVIELLAGEFKIYRPIKIFTPRFDRSFQMPPPGTSPPLSPPVGPVFEQVAAGAPQTSYCVSFLAVGLPDWEDEEDLRASLRGQPEPDGSYYLVAARAAQRSAAGDDGGCV